MRNAQFLHPLLLSSLLNLGRKWKGLFRHHRTYSLLQLIAPSFLALCVERTIIGLDTPIAKGTYSEP